MSLQCGIAGLPNVGKSTLFNALTAAAAAVENRPFCTVEPNRAIARVPDDRLAEVSALFEADKVTAATLELVDIAGLVEGASRGEGLGNAFLAQIREVDALVHVVRCFEDPSISHQYGSVDPVRDVEVVRTELLLKDLETVERRLDKSRRAAKVGQKDARAQMPILERFHEALGSGHDPAAAEDDEDARALLGELFLLAAKPTVYVANVDDGQLGQGSSPVRDLVAYASARGEPVVEVSASIEAEVAELAEEDRAEFFGELGLGGEPTLPRLVRAIYDLLGLHTFFTVVGTEIRAWPIPAGTTAVEAAGKVHSDMAKGFIKAEVVPWTVLVEQGSEAAARDRGLLSTEGRDYVVRDGDVVRFRFRS